MPKGGSKPGERRGGRQKGARNKATIQREIEAGKAAAEAIDKARSGQIELAKDVLRRLMKIAEGITSLNRPTTVREIDAGTVPNKDGDWERFGQWFDRTVYCAKELARYESPTFKAVLLQQDTPQPLAPQSNDVLDLQANRDPAQATQTYLRLVAAPKAA